MQILLGQGSFVRVKAFVDVPLTALTPSGLRKGQACLPSSYDPAGIIFHALADTWHSFYFNPPGMSHGPLIRLSSIRSECRHLFHA